ncbi:MAG: AraC family transcriptional regulator [Bacilli bacterium]|nr:AraC family transcriptional regulator [Bacilli bacterium]
MARRGFQNSSHPLGSQIDLNFYYCGKQDCDAGHSWGPGIRDHYKFHYIHGGEGILKMGDKTYHLTEGQGFVIFPHSLVYYKADQHNPWIYSWVAFQGLQAESYLERAHLSTSRPVFESAGNTWFETFFDQLEEARRSARGGDLKYQSILYRLLGELIDSSAADTKPGPAFNYKESYVRKAIEFFEMNYSQKISISEVADLIRVDRKYLATLFKRTLGLSPQVFLLRLRMNKACELMANGELTIADISRSIGYNDPLLFSKMFKRVVGISPRQYRETHLTKVSLVK